MEEKKIIKDIRNLRQNLRKKYNELTKELCDVTLKFDKYLEDIEKGLDKEKERMLNEQENN